jgi:Nucleotidyl transferase AbiEii toxin, Type IV TA system
LFERPHHQRIATVLQALDAEQLLAHACYFGGGTALALSLGEYRESVDIDFLVSNIEGYRALRQRLSGPQGIASIVRAGMRLTPGREVRADQYGIRTMLLVDGVGIKFEVVLEARIKLDVPQDSSDLDTVCGVTLLTPLDRITTKLLAHSDRWRDDSVFSRDLIDLAMLQPSKKMLSSALIKARTAYGSSIDTDLEKSVQYLRDRPHRLDQCMAAMAINSVPKALLWKRIKALVS